MNKEEVDDFWEILKNEISKILQGNVKSWLATSARKCEKKINTTIVGK